MLNKYFKCTLGDNQSPFAPRQKPIWPAIIAGAAGLLGTGIGALVNKSSTDSANSQNYKIHQEQLAAQRYQYEDQKAENRYLVNQAYERNLPINQVKALREAGINPAFAMDAGAFSSQGAQTGSAPNGPAIPNAPTMQPVDYSGLGVGIGNSLSAAVDSYYRSKESDRADYALASDITTSHMSAFANLLNSFSKAKEVGVNEKWLNRQYQIAMDNFWLEVDKNASDKELRNIKLGIEQEANDLRALEIQISERLAASKISVDKADIGRIAQQIQESKDTVLEMKKNGASNRVVQRYANIRERQIIEKLIRENHLLSKTEKMRYVAELSKIFGEMISPIKELSDETGATPGSGTRILKKVLK